MECFHGENGIVEPLTNQCTNQ